ncbi:FAD-dependent oxidoreductase [Sphingomonas sp. Mn802worker]|uniref:FAD-dependent oxidoreductase n=1 Tax=Sphingomonas sp. Mn802worker TaxID=629773 RepID=UPI0003A52DA8|nr:FAD-dependent oxidoreductase [Sphingomonas sp. Mn802worker]
MAWSAQALSVTEALVFGLGQDPLDEQRRQHGAKPFVREGAWKGNAPVEQSTEGAFTMPLDHKSTYDVIIAGAGPVGLFLACELGLAGCRVLVLERSEASASALKRLPFGLRGLNLPTMESLDRRDLLTPLKARMALADTLAAAPWTAGARRPAGHFAGLQFLHDMVDQDAWPWRCGAAVETLAVTMADIEHVLLTRASELGVVIRYGCSVDGVAETADGVEVHAGGTTHQAGWLVGCDGGRSTVRKSVGISFAGTEPEFTGYSMTLCLEEPNQLRPGRQHTATGMYTYAPPGTVTMVDFDGGVNHRTLPVTREHVQAVLRRVSETNVTVEAVDLATTWTDRAFIAASYIQGRVLLAGDAAHVHAPLGGQGLNLGLGDAMNLGWKLAGVIADRAPRSLLDSYEQERRPIANQVLEWSRAQVALLRPDPGTAALRAVVHDLMETRDGATFFAGRVWGAGLRCELPGAAHPLLGRSAPEMPLADGRRLNEALRRGRPVLIDFDPSDPLAEVGRASSQLDYCVSPQGHRAIAEALLIRPDGVVAWAGSIVDRADLIRLIARLFDPLGTPT